MLEKLIKELNNREIIASLEIEHTIKESCKALGIEPNSHLDLIKTAYKRCTGEELPFTRFKTEYEEKYRFYYQMVSSRKSFLEHDLRANKKANLRYNLEELEHYYKLLPEAPEWFTEEQLEEYRRRVEEMLQS